jgi:hypothetical protein
MIPAKDKLFMLDNWKDDKSEEESIKNEIEVFKELCKRLHFEITFTVKPQAFRKAQSEENLF